MSETSDRGFEKRVRMIELAQSGALPQRKVAEVFGLDERTLRKWLRRFEAEGLAGLRERSRRPKSSPNATPPEIVEQLLAKKAQHPKWGPKKIRDRLILDQPEVPWPAKSTVEGYFKAKGLVKKREYRYRAPKGERPDRTVHGPNELMTIDFKGDFLLGNGRRCYPLTIADEWSRWIHCCKALPSTELEPVQRELTAIFREFGMPQTILDDAGGPFATKGLRRISRFGVWLIELGIRQMVSRPSSPQDNPIHERMHRTLKTETEIAFDFTDQQLVYDDWQHVFNFIRPHESLGGRPPSQLYRPSRRPFPEVIAPPEYTSSFQVRKVDIGGRIKLGGERIFISEAFAGKRVGLVESDDDLWTVFFYDREVARFQGAQRRVW